MAQYTQNKALYDEKKGGTAISILVQIIQHNTLIFKLFIKEHHY